MKPAAVEATDMAAVKRRRRRSATSVASKHPANGKGCNRRRERPF